MSAKQIIALVIGILALSVTAWKGPQAWGLIASGLTAIVIFVSTVKLTPAKDEEYIADLEDALEKTSVASTGSTTLGGMPARSRARLVKRLGL